MGMAPSLFSSRGLTLVEVVVATGVLVTVLAGLAQLLAVTSRRLADVGQTAVADAAAGQKLEGLLTAPWTVDAAGAPVSSPALETSPAGSLQNDTADYVDYLDEHGALAAGADAARGGAYVRRWSVRPTTPVDPDTLALEVCVFRAGGPHGDPSEALACVGSVKTRRP
jgi:hypothetical protein